jgi:GAF domain-containing protein
MSDHIRPSDVISAISELSKIPLSNKSEGMALEEIVQMGRGVLESRAFTLVKVNMDKQTLVHVACAGFDDLYEHAIKNHVIKIGDSSRGAFVDFNVVAKGGNREWYGLQEQGQGVVNPKTARAYNFNSLLSYALQSEEGLIGYLNHFALKNGTFTDEERSILGIFGRHAQMVIERFEYLQSYDHSLHIVNDLSQGLLSLSPDEFLQQVSLKAAELLAVPVCIVWTLDENRDSLHIVATTNNVDEEYKKIQLARDDPGIRRHLASRSIGYLKDVRIRHPEYYKHHEEASKRGWISLLTAPMWSGNELIGMLDIYTKEVRKFKKKEEEFFDAFARHAAVSIQKAELLRDKAMHAEIRRLRERDRIIGEIRQAVANFTNNDGNIEGELNEVLEIIVRRCATAVSANVCMIHLLNTSTGNWELRRGYTSSPHNEFTVTDDFEEAKALAASVADDGESLMCPDTSANKRCAGWLTRANISSLICVPIKSGEAVIGTITVGNGKIGALGTDEKDLLEGIVDSVSNAIRRADLADNMLSLAQASHAADSLQALLQHLVESTRDLMKEPVCLVWLLDKDRNGFVPRAYVLPEKQDIDADELFISNNATGIQEFLHRKMPLFFENAGNVGSHPYGAVLSKLEWKSMLAMPLVVRNRVNGILEVYSYKTERNFTNWHRKLFASWAAQASIAIVNVRARNRLLELGEITRSMASTNDTETLLNLILDSGLTLSRSKRGWISQLDPVSGKLKGENYRGNPETVKDLEVGKGITGLALQQEELVRVPDVTAEQWKDTYVEYWPDSRSELAVPIIVSNAEAHIGTGTEPRSKPIGVLNVESPTLDAFSEADAESLQSLAQMAAIIIERLELDRKLRELTDVETEIVRERGYENTIKIIMKAITETLGYDYVNISLVIPERNRIRTEYIVGIDESRVARFKELADHSLDGDDIQAWVVRNKEKILVPGPEDKGKEWRFDEKIYKEFGHKDLIRVFLPMIVPSDGRVIGTVEAGYRALGYRKYIYEQDVQILQGFLSYAVPALENRKKGLIEQICHEFRAPAVGIRSNAEYLLKWVGHLDEERMRRKTETKFGDIIMDSEAILLQVRELEFLLGKPLPESRPEFTRVMRDIVVKTVKQLKPDIEEKGFSLNDVEYRNEDIGKINIYVDRLKLYQVINNLLINSIKYSEDEPRDFKIRIFANVTPDGYVIVFKDWGIGIRKGLEEKVFELGFRTPEAVDKNVTGSGLGLTLARKIMRDMGGDLLLVNNHGPTEFHVVLPKKLRETKR